MPFIKKGEAEIRKKVAAANTARRQENAKRKNAAKGNITSIEEEKQYGLASVFKVRCCKCFLIYEIGSSSPTLDTSGLETGRSLYAVNVKLVLGCIDAGLGHGQMNKLLTAANFPTMEWKTFKHAEERVGPCTVDVAQESCVEAIAEERESTIKKRNDQSPNEESIK